MPYTEVTVLLALASFGCGTGENVEQDAVPLRAVCIDPFIAPPADALVCGQTLTMECQGPNGSDPGDLYVPLDRTQCAGATLTVSDRGPFSVGSHEVIVRDASNGNDEVCRSTLIVEDHTDPTFTTHDVALWPPNHKWHTIGVDDCVTVTDDCDDDVDVEFLWASSDEVVNGNGDGNHEPDIRNLSCGSVELRAERAGPMNGRVYHIGWRADDNDGNVVEGVCEVRVEHDQSGRRAIDDGEAYRVNAPAECGEVEGGGSGQLIVPPPHTPEEQTPPPTSSTGV